MAKEINQVSLLGAKKTNKTKEKNINIGEKMKHPGVKWSINWSLYIYNIHIYNLEN